MFQGLQGVLEVPRQPGNSTCAILRPWAHFWSLTCLGNQGDKLLNPALPSFGLFPWQHCGLAASGVPTRQDLDS